jgi:hypothetical protein
VPAGLFIVTSFYGGATPDYGSRLKTGNGVFMTGSGVFMTGSDFATNIYGQFAAIGKKCDLRHI